MASCRVSLKEREREDVNPEFSGSCTKLPTEGVVSPMRTSHATFLNNKVQCNPKIEYDCIQISTASRGLADDLSLAAPQPLRPKAHSQVMGK